MSLVRVIFSGEFLFFAFIYAGIFKEEFDFIPIDLTVLLAVLTFIIAGKRLIRKPLLQKSTILPITLYVMLSALMIFSLLYTPGQAYAMEKSVKFITVTAWAFLGVPFLINDKESLSRFLKSGIIIMTAIALKMLFNYFTGSTSMGSYSRVSFSGGSVISSARGLGVAIITLVLLYTYNKIGFSKKFISTISLSLLLFAMFLTGTRMPLLSLFAVIALLILSSFKINKNGLRINKGIISILIAIFSVLIILIPFSDKFSTLTYRLQTLFDSQGGGSSVLERTARYEAALNMFKNAPLLGNGVGSFSIEYIGIDRREYAHNIILELLSEIGLLGFLVFAALILFGVLRVVNYSRNNVLSVEQKCVILASIFLFVNANVSGDLNDNRSLFTFISLMYMIPFYQKGERKRMKLSKV